jgi:hypothetical protein
MNIMRHNWLILNKIHKPAFQRNNYHANFLGHLRFNTPSRPDALGVGYMAIWLLP